MVVNSADLWGVITGKKASENFGDEADKLARTAKKVQGSAMEHHKDRAPAHRWSTRPLNLHFNLHFWT